MKIVKLNNEDWLECTGMFLADSEHDNEYYTNMNIPIPERGTEEISTFLNIRVIASFNDSSDEGCTTVRDNYGKTFIIKGSTFELRDILMTLNNQ